MTLSKTKTPTIAAAFDCPAAEWEDDRAAQFDRLADEWEAGRPRGADIAQMTAHPAYQGIIAMGKPAVPHILDRLAAKPDHWFVALHAITGASPVAPENHGRFKAMTAAWLKWGQEQGYRE